MVKRIVTISLGIFFFSLPVITGKNNKGYEIMKKVRDQSRIHKTQRSEVSMVIKDKKGRTRERFFNHLKKQKGKNSSSMVKFFQPSSIKGTSLLSKSNDEQLGTDQWIYLPALRSVKKLSSEDKNQSFMGSDFSNSDIAGRNLKQDQHRLLREDDKYFYIESKPKDTKDSYSRIVSKVHKKIYIPTEVKFYDKKKRHLKTMKNFKIKKFKGMYVVVQSEMKNLKTKGKTTLDVSKIKIGLNISDNDVGIRGLKK